MIRPVLLCLVVVASACASVRSTGSFIEHPTTHAMRDLARDAAHHLALLYPPARTQLSLAQPTNDAFGQSLLTELRGVGFAVAETHSRGTQLALSYAVDEVDPFYRVVLRIASARRRISLTRGYAHHTKTVLAAGAWTQQEAP